MKASWADRECAVETPLVSTDDVRRALLREEDSLVTTKAGEKGAHELSGEDHHAGVGPVDLLVAYQVQLQTKTVLLFLQGI